MNEDEAMTLIGAVVLFTVIAIGILFRNYYCHYGTP